MGTNYYLMYPAERNHCESCGRKYEPKKVHLGKDTLGWAFSFRGYDNVKNFDQWVEMIEDGIKEGAHIEDEYEDIQDPDEFIEFAKNKEGMSHHAWCQEYKPDLDTAIDDCGHSFSFNEFC